MEFKALRVPALTEEVAANLDRMLAPLPGVMELKITLDTQELYIVFDEDQLGFQTLIQEMSKAGCPLRNIDAALLL
jgi:copper chaperone CopZ